MSVITEIIESVIGKQPPEIMSWLETGEIVSATLGDSIAESSLIAKIPAHGAFKTLCDKVIVEETKTLPEPEKNDILSKREKRERGEQLSLF